ncbi:MAG: ABC-type sugar transport system, periplasmic component [Anaerocolumna sp.]|nr:ABC-type sugar transport system, periplasmic component [Anaerocolumna sp.]
MKYKKILSTTMLAVMAGTLLIGCKKINTFDKTNVNGNNKNNAVELTFYNGETEDPWTDPVALALTEATGVKIKTESGITSDGQKIALMIAEQNYPDLIFTKDQASYLIDAGALIDLTDLINEYGPNIKKLYGSEFEKLKYSKEDPSIYMLSAYAVGGTVYSTGGTAQLQWDVLKANNYIIPKSLIEYENMIKEYLYAHPMTEDGLETIGLTLSTTDWHWMITLGNPAGTIASGTLNNGQWLIDDNYNAIYRFRTDKEKEYFRWLNRMYNEGILDPEFATQTHEDYISKITSGRVLSLLDADWDYAEAEKVLKAAGKLGKTYSGLPVTMDESVKCVTLAYQGMVTGQGVGISNSCKDPVTAIKFLNYICSDEGQVLINWGIEGINYLVDDKGHRYRTSEEIERANTDKNYIKTTGVGFHTYPLPSYSSGVEDSTGNTYTPINKETVIAEYNKEQKAACKAWEVELLTDIFPQASEFEVPKYSPIWGYSKPTKFNEISSKLDEISWTGLVSCVISKEVDFDAKYDAMVVELERNGMYYAEKMLSSIVKDKVSLISDEKGIAIDE